MTDDLIESGALGLEIDPITAHGFSIQHRGGIVQGTAVIFPELNGRDISVLGRIVQLTGAVAQISIALCLVVHDSIIAIRRKLCMNCKSSDKSQE